MDNYSVMIQLCIFGYKLNAYTQRDAASHSFSASLRLREAKS